MHLTIRMPIEELYCKDTRGKSNRGRARTARGFGA